MSSGGRHTTERLRPPRRRVALRSTLVVAVSLVGIEGSPAHSARIDQGEHRSVTAWRFAEVVRPPTPGTPWPDVVDALRRAGGSHEVSQSPSGAHFAHHAARCIANNPGLDNPHHIATDQRCGAGVDRAAARIGAANSAISMRSDFHSPRQIIEGLAARPFHSMALLDPSVTVVDLASTFRPRSPVVDQRFVAATWLSSTGTAPEPAAMSVVMWPAPGWSVPGEFTAAEEWPSPLGPCGVEVSGPPIWIAVPHLERAPRLDSLRLSGADSVTDLCVYSASEFDGTDPEAVAVGRQAMERLSAVVIVPLTPLAAGDYVLDGRLEGRPFRRSITVGPSH